MVLNNLWIFENVRKLSYEGSALLLSMNPLDQLICEYLAAILQLIIENIA
jgi:hypothetical protein